MVKRALLIGINYFGTGAQLEGCHNDVDMMQEYLVARGYSEFVILKDSQADPQHEKFDSPTRANIMRAMQVLAAKTVPGEVLIVHYSGHGSYTHETVLGRDEVDGIDETICPVDYATNGDLSDDKLNDLLVDGLAGGTLRVVLDCCHSGSGLDLPYRWVGRDSWTAEGVEASEKNILMISGCRDNQTSADASFAGVPNGALTRCLLDSLAEIDNKTNWLELMVLLRLKLSRGRYSQVPQLSAANKKIAKSLVDF